MKLFSVVVFLIVSIGGPATAVRAQEAKRPNVLFIAVDDLRPQLACYGETEMHTPGFDALAARSVLFEQSFCMVPTCGASRASLMTGLRPHPRRFVSYTARADEEAPEAVTLNTHFKSNGYTTVSLGKIFHFPKDSAAGWSKPAWRPPGDDYSSKQIVKQAIADHLAKFPKAKARKKKMRGAAFDVGTKDDTEYRDYQTASEAIRHLDEFAGDSQQPFFLAVGFVKPHLPFCAPKKYWDLYDYDKIDVPSNFAVPTDLPGGAVHTSGELRSYSGIPPKGPVDRETARHLIHGYYACVSMIDAQVTRLMQSLDQNNLSDNTIVILWGDHGWQLGEHGMWNKHSCFETSMHTPLFISAPGIKGGQRTAALTEFIDIYPTLCELSGIAIPDHVDGTSLVPQLRDPSLPGKDYAVGRFQSGDTIRSKDFRLSQFRKSNGAGVSVGTMLFDHRSDPDENENVVDVATKKSTAKLLTNELNDRKGKQ